MQEYSDTCISHNFSFITRFTVNCASVIMMGAIAFFCRRAEAVDQPLTISLNEFDNLPEEVVNGRFLDDLLTLSTQAAIQNWPDLKLKNHRLIGIKQRMLLSVVSAFSDKFSQPISFDKPSIHVYAPNADDIDFFTIAANKIVAARVSLSGIGPINAASIFQQHIGLKIEKGPRDPAEIDLWHRDNCYSSNAIGVVIWTLPASVTFLDKTNNALPHPTLLIKDYVRESGDITDYKYEFIPGTPTENLPPNHAGFIPKGFPHAIPASNIQRGHSPIRGLLISPISLRNTDPKHSL